MDPIDPYAFASTARTLLLEDRSRWRLWGIYWFLVKALLKKVYPYEEMPLGEFMDESIINMMPVSAGLPDLLGMACEEYGFNATLGAGRAQVEDRDGQTVLVVDPDMGC